MNKQSRKVLLGAATLAAVMAAGGKAEAATGNINMSAQIIAAITIASQASLNFGTITVDATAVGTVTVDDSNSRVAGGGVSLVGGAGAQSGVFRLTAAPNIPYDVTIDAGASATIKLNGTMAPTLVVDNFTLSGAPGTAAGLSHTGAFEDYNFGGRLTVPGGTAAGTYTGAVQITAVYQ